MLIKQTEDGARASEERTKDELEKAKYLTSPTKLARLEARLHRTSSYSRAGAGEQG